MKATIHTDVTLLLQLHDIYNSMTDGQTSTTSPIKLFHRPAWTKAHDGISHSQVHQNAEHRNQLTVAKRHTLPASGTPKYIPLLPFSHQRPYTILLYNKNIITTVVSNIKHDVLYFAFLPAF
jgi:hypothetical protein